MHKRTEIRNAVKAMLLNATTCGANVYSNRVSTFWKAELPSISIFTTDEEAQPRDLRAQSYVVNMNLRIEIHAEANEDLDETLDDLSKEVQDLIQANQDLTGTCLGSVYTGAQIELADNGTTQIGVASLNFSVKYIG